MQANIITLAIGKNSNIPGQIFIFRYNNLSSGRFDFIKNSLNIGIGIQVEKRSFGGGFETGAFNKRSRNPS
jgi:hypothetical protein